MAPDAAAASSPPAWRAAHRWPDGPPRRCPNWRENLAVPPAHTSETLRNSSTIWARIRVEMVRCGIYNRARVKKVDVFHPRNPIADFHIGLRKVALYI